jgi:hypothetical protein
MEDDGTIHSKPKMNTPANKALRSLLEESF